MTKVRYVSVRPNTSPARAINPYAVATNAMATFHTAIVVS